MKEKLEENDDRNNGKHPESQSPLTIFQDVHARIILKLVA